MINNTRAETSVIRHADRNFDVTLLKVNEASHCILLRQALAEVHCVILSFCRSLAAMVFQW